MRSQDDDASTLHRKAAAWAWYRHQHGERGRARRGDAPLHLNLAAKIALQSKHRHSQHPHQGSRFRSEAHKQNTVVNTDRSLALLSLLPREQSTKCFQRQRKDGKQTDPDPWDCGSTLYDSFELLTLSNLLGRCLTTVHAVTSISPSLSGSTPPPPTTEETEAANSQRPFSFSRILSIPRFIPFSKVPEINPVTFSPKSEIKSRLKKAFQSIVKSFHNKLPDSAKQYHSLGEGKQHSMNGNHNQQQNHREESKKISKSGNQCHDEDQKEHRAHEHNPHRQHCFTPPRTMKPRKPLQPKLSNGLYGPFLPMDVRSVMQPVTNCRNLKKPVSIKRSKEG